MIACSSCPLSQVRRLSLHHSELLAEAKSQVVAKVVEHIRSLRSAVAKNALLTVGDMFFALKRELDSEASNVVAAICKRFMDSSNFLIKAAQSALLEVICNTTETKTLMILLGYIDHRNPGVRANVLRGIAALLRHAGSSIEGTRELQKLLEAMSKIAQDSNGDVRAGAREVVRCLAMDVRLDSGLFEQYIPDNVVRMAMRESDDRAFENGTADRRRRRTLQSPSTSLESPLMSSRKQPASSARRTRDASPRPSSRASQDFAEVGGVEQLPDLYRKLTASDWRDRIEAVTAVRCFGRK